MTHSLSVAGADKSASDVAQGDVGDRRIQHFHEGRNDNGECDEPRIDDPRGRRFDTVEAATDDAAFIARPPRG